MGGLGGQRFKIATVAGIPIYLASSWLIIAALYLYAQYLRLINSTPAPTQTTALGLAVFGAVLFFGAVLIHEGAHAVMARRLGLPVLAITLVFWGGATETRANARGALGEFLVAMAGPLSTLILAGVLYVVAGATEGLVHAILLDLSGLNLLFAVVNALPAFPLDGGRMLLAATWGITRSRRTAIRIAAAAGTLIGGAALAGAVYLFLNPSRYAGWAFFMGYMGFILMSAGSATQRRIGLRDQLGVGTAAEAMRAPPGAVPASMPVAQAIDAFLEAHASTVFPVAEAGRMVGTISLQPARKASARDPQRTVAAAMTPLAQSITVAPADPLDEVLEWLAGREGFVLRDGALIGAIGPDDVERWYRRRYESSTVPRPPPRPDR